MAQGVDSSDVAAVFIAALGALAAAKLMEYLSERRESPVNRYQAAVAAQSAATVVAQPLERLAEVGWLYADGDPKNPNERTYRLSDRVAKVFA